MIFGSDSLLFLIKTYSIWSRFEKINKCKDLITLKPWNISRMWQRLADKSTAACRLTLLIPRLEGKYGRWPNTEAYDWRSQWEGSVSKPFCKLSKRYIDFFTSRTAFRKISLFSGFSLHPTITSETIGIWSAVTHFLPDLDNRQFAELPRSWCEPSREGNLEAFWRFPTELKGNDEKLEEGGVWGKIV